MNQKQVLNWNVKQYNNLSKQNWKLRATILYGQQILKLYWCSNVLLLAKNHQTMASAPTKHAWNQTECHFSKALQHFFSKYMYIVQSLLWVIWLQSGQSESICKVPLLKCFYIMVLHAVSLSSKKVICDLCGPYILR